MKVAWISYLDAQVFGGGGELTQRRLIAEGRRRGHDVVEASFLRSRPQRALRRTGLYRRLPVPWDADVFILANLRNSPHLRQRIPSQTVDRALATRRAFVLENAWVDLCPFDLPCDGDPRRCPPACDRRFADRLFRNAAGAIFVSPAHRDTFARLLRGPLPSSIIIHPMVDADRFRPLGLERDIDVLYVGTISRAKGYEELLERFGAHRLTLAGQNELGHLPEGRWLGVVGQDDLPMLYNRARTFAHLPRWREPFGRTVVEATLCGCEVITNERVGAMSFAREHRADPAVVRRHPAMFWDAFERRVEEVV